MIWTNWICTVSGSFHLKLSFSDPLVLEKIFEMTSSFFLHFWLSPFWSGAFNKFWIPFTQGKFLPSLNEIGWMVLVKKIFKKFSVFLLFCYYLPLGWPSFEQFWVPFTKKLLVPTLLKIGPTVLEKSKT
jgi:hypothetical protein